MKLILLAILLAVAMGCASPDWSGGAPGGVSWQWPSGWDLDVGWAAFANAKQEDKL